jgi:hypothetical protein
MTDARTISALQRYEAQALPLSSVSDAQLMEIYSPFGPMIGKSRLPGTLIERLNKYGDDGLLESPEGGQLVIPESVLTAGKATSLGQFLADKIIHYVESVDNRKVASLQFMNLWIVSQFASTPSPMHFHSSDISGVLYLKTPQLEEQLEDLNYIGGRQAGFINFINGNKQAFNKSLISFKPEIGDLYIFPGWLMHGAEAFKGSGERRSLAFNADITF